MSAVRVLKADSLVLRRLDITAEDDETHAELERLVRRGAVPDREVRAGAREILDDVARRGAAAVRDANRRVGGGLSDGRLIVEPRELAAARDRLPRELRGALEAAIANVGRFAAAQLPTSTRVETVPGVEIERRWQPVDRVGCYAPGGSAAYPSSVVMTAVPARVAGVDAVVLASPAAPDGEVPPALAGAAGLVGVDALLVAGGAQAIGALAYGLADLDLAPVDLVVGPGNAWVTAAKLEVAGMVAIDLPAGPSEGLVLADATADPATVAADLLTQAEHGPDSVAILVTTDAGFADAVDAELLRRLETAERRAILAASLGAHGRTVLAPDLAAAVGFVNAYAPEHLSIDVGPLEETVAAVRNAGSIFVGRWAPESAGDYATGANHVLPTGGLARGRGALGVETFGRFLQVQRISRDGLASLRPTIVSLATAEGLGAHRDAVETRFDRRSGTVPAVES